MKISVVIPAYNEAATIVQVVERVRAVDLDKEIVIVDDASVDGTWDRLLELKQRFDDLTVIRHEVNRGTGAALRTGFGAATGEIVVIQDADLENDPAEFPKLTAPILAGEADVVYGSRFLDNPELDRRSASYVANRVLTWLTNVVSGSRLTDMETCSKVFRRHVLDGIEIKSDRFGFEPEFTVKLARNGVEIHEVPVRYAPRSAAEGKKVNWRDGVKAVVAILWFRVFD